MARAIHIHIHRGKAYDASKPFAAGIVHVSPDGKVFLMKRASTSAHGGTWGLPAGKIEPGETTQQAAERETFEEAGVWLSTPVRELWDDGHFVCFCRRSPKFAPILNAEHTAYEWADPNNLPRPLHPNVREQVAAAISKLRS